MPSTIGKCKLFRIKHITLLEGETFLRNKHEIAFFEIKCTFCGRKENTINVDAFCPILEESFFLTPPPPPLMWCVQAIWKGFGLHWAIRQNLYNFHILFDDFIPTVTFLCGVNMSRMYTQIFWKYPVWLFLADVTS